MLRRVVRCTTLVVVCLTLLLAGSAHAQERHPLSGRVVDSSGAVIVGATVTVTNESGGTWSARSDARGEFRIAELAPGTYRIQVAHRQFVRAQVTSRVDGASPADVR